METLPILLCLIICGLCNIQANNQWNGEKWLKNDYLIKWKTDDINKKVIFRAEVMTKGWIGFGFSKHGKKLEVDMVIGWVDDVGQSTFKDFWVNEYGIHSLDSSQDWHLISAVENLTHTVLEFFHDYNTCDEHGDVEIFENEYELSNIMFAYSLSDPTSVQTVGEPAFEAVLQLNLFSSEGEYEPKEQDIQSLDNWLNVTIPPRSKNNFFCVIIKNNMDVKKTVVKQQPFTFPPDTGVISHHLVMSVCEDDHDEALFRKHQGNIFPCYEETNPLRVVRKKCTTRYQITAFFSNSALSFPHNVGMPYDQEKMPYFLLEGHFINPTDKEGKLAVSMRLWMTKKLRKYEANMGSFGGASGFGNNNWGLIVPPGQPSFRAVSIISSYCFEDDEFKKNGIFLFALMFHTHFGLSHELRHYREDRLNRIIRYNNFSPNPQSYVHIKSALHFQMKDKLIARCEYSSINETKTYTSPQEHCVLTFYYYPKVGPKFDTNYYFSQISYSTMLKVTGLQQIDNYSYGTQDQIIIRRPVQYNNTKLIDFITDNKYKVKDPGELEQILISSDMVEYCFEDRVHDDFRPSKPITKPPGLYESIKNERKPSYCPPGKFQTKSKAKEISWYESSPGWTQSEKKFKISLKLLMNLVMI